MTGGNKPRQPRQVPLCIYCEGRLGLTRDHVSPRSLFPVRPGNMITVPVCEPCNREKSRDEPYLRDVLTTDRHGYEHPAAQALFQGKVRRSIRYTSSDFARDARAQASPRPTFTPEGIYLGNRMVVPVEKARIDRVLALMVRGLLYHLRERRIPRDYVFDVNLVKPESVVDTVRAFVVLPHHGPFAWGERACACIFVQAADNPATTL